MFPVTQISVVGQRFPVVAGPGYSTVVGLKFCNKILQIFKLTDSSWRGPPEVALKESRTGMSQKTGRK